MPGVKLRTRRERSRPEEALFEYSLEGYDYNEPLRLVGAGEGDKSLVDQLRALWPAQLPASPSNNAQRHPQAVSPSRELDGASTAAAAGARDPLDPLDFRGHHRRMEREEKRMQHCDRLQLAAEAERLGVQRAALLEADWRTAIPGIVKIDDPTDPTELEGKRRLALDEMNLFMARYKRLKEQDRAGRDKRDGSADPKDPRTPVRGASSKPARKQKQNKRKHKLRRIASSAPPSSDSEHEPLTLCIPVFAFGYGIPSAGTRPTEFDIPDSWKKTTTEL